jgi:hypothetical protein
VNPRERVVDNPFFVLGVARDAARPDIERAAQRLLAELSIGRQSALAYSTPLGPAQRTEDKVRAAAAELRDPAKRLVHEAWATLAAEPTPAPGFEPISWPLALRLIGGKAEG